MSDHLGRMLASLRKINPRPLLREVRAHTDFAVFWYGMDQLPKEPAPIIPGLGVSIIRDDDVPVGEIESRYSDGSRVREPFVSTATAALFRSPAPTPAQEK